MKRRSAPAFRLLSMTTLGPFSWQWPANLERFDRGWVAVAEVDGHEFHVRHGIGRRDVFGRSRVHSVTWVEGRPIIEGVEADDYRVIQALQIAGIAPLTIVCPKYIERAATVTSA